jgi:hypothetical protein
MPPFSTDLGSSNHNGNNNDPFGVGLDDTSGSQAGVIAGSIIGATLLVLCVVGAFMLYNRRQTFRMAQRAASLDTESGGERGKPPFDVPLPRYPEPAEHGINPPPYSKDFQAVPKGVTSPPIFALAEDNVEPHAIDVSMMRSMNELGRPPQYTRS